MCTHTSETTSNVVRMVSSDQLEPIMGKEYALEVIAIVSMLITARSFHQIGHHTHTHTHTHTHIVLHVSLSPFPLAAAPHAFAMHTPFPFPAAGNLSSMKLTHQQYQLRGNAAKVILTLLARHLCIPFSNLPAVPEPDAELIRLQCCIPLQFCRHSSAYLHGWQ